MAEKKTNQKEDKEKKVVAKKTTAEKKDAAPAKKPAAKKPAAKATAKKSVTTKDAKKTTKATQSTKKTAEKKTVKKVEPKKPVKLVFDPRTGKMVAASKKKEEVKKPETEKVDEKDKKKKKVAKPKVKVTSKELTIETEPKAPVEVVRPTPKKVKELNKEDKVIYKQLMDNFTFVANMAMVIEDRTMDRKQITDLTIGELHVVETVNRLNNKPMTSIARAEHVTVGALTICVNRLVQKGYLLRIRDEMDRRIILLSVTQKAKKVLKVHDKFHDDIVGLALEHVSLSKANEVMAKFAEMLEYYYDPVGYEKKLAATTKKKKK